MAQLTGALRQRKTGPNADGRTPDAASFLPRRVLLFPVLAALLATAVLLNVGIGAVEIGPARVLAILASHAGIDAGPSFTTQQDSVL